MYHTLLFFHVLGAFALIAGTSAMAPFALRWGQAALERGTASLAFIGSILSGVGAVLTLGLGLWLVSNRDYSFFRFWILSALVLWAIAGYSNGRVAGAAREVKNGAETAKNVRTLWVVDALGAALLLVLMIWKPGA